VYSRPGNYLDEHKEIVIALKGRDPQIVESVIRKHIENDWKYYSQQYQAALSNVKSNF
jgi:DNA-binding GntR family transcriptional regulator